MFSKIIFFMMIPLFAFTMSVDEVKDATKNKLGCIKGLGDKRVKAIILYREENELNVLEDLLTIRGIGKGILKNIKEDIKKKVCTNFDKSTPKGKSRKKNITAQ